MNQNEPAQESLSAFLLARIAEDEAAARAAVAVSEDAEWWVDGPAEKTGKWWVYDTGERFTHKPIADHIARHDPARVLVECEAKRRIVEMSRPRYALFYRESDRLLAEALSSEAMPTVAVSDPVWPFPQAEGILQILAMPYADHPDYRDEWRP